LQELVAGRAGLAIQGELDALDAVRVDVGGGQQPDRHPTVGHVRRAGGTEERACEQKPQGYGLFRNPMQTSHPGPPAELSPRVPKYMPAPRLAATAPPTMPQNHQRLQTGGP